MDALSVAFPQSPNLDHTSEYQRELKPETRRPLLFWTTRVDMRVHMHVHDDGV